MAAFALAADRDQDLAKEELNRLQGSWVRVYWLLDCWERPLSEEKVIMTFTGSKFVIKAGEKLLEEGTMGSLIRSVPGLWRSRFHSVGWAVLPAAGFRAG